MFTRGDKIAYYSLRSKYITGYTKEMSTQTDESSLGMDAKKLESILASYKGGPRVLPTTNLGEGELRNPSTDANIDNRPVVAEVTDADAAHASDKTHVTHRHEGKIVIINPQNVNINSTGLNANGRGMSAPYTETASQRQNILPRYLKAFAKLRQDDDGNFIYEDTDDTKEDSDVDSDDVDCETSSDITEDTDRNPDDIEEFSDSDTEYKPRKKKQKSQEFWIMSPDEKKYYQTMTKKERAKVMKIAKDIHANSNIGVPYRFQILQSGMSDTTKAFILDRANKLLSMNANDSEYHKLSTYVNGACKIPFGKYVDMPVNASTPVPKIVEFLDQTRERLNACVYGHDKAKDQVIRLLAQWISNPQSKGLVIGIEGAPGVGKTQLAKNGICKSLGLPFGFLPLGGASDGSYLLGHSYTYEGAHWGQIADILMKVKCMNPILYFDELDKVSETKYGEEIINTLIHLTDPSQNDSFHDKYFAGVPIDLSRSLVIFSFNHGELINPILRDRMVIIKTDGYNQKHKTIISQKHLLPDMASQFGFSPQDIVFSDEVMQYVIANTADEKGVRNLKRSLEEIYSKINLARLLKENIKTPKGDEIPVVFPFYVTKETVDALLSKQAPVNTSLQMMYM